MAKEARFSIWGFVLPGVFLNLSLIYFDRVGVDKGILLRCSEEPVFPYLDILIYLSQVNSMCR